MSRRLVFRHQVLVVGSGAAGYHAAVRLKEFGLDVAILTEDRMAGTSRNAGSDKQTYYKLSLAGREGDSVREMAEDLFRGGAVDGDTAYSEAALSARCFLYLAEAGVPFPQDETGAYVGYKTDHDPHARASSAGPLTSRQMTEVLERRADVLQIPVYEHLYAVKIVKDGEVVCGLVGIDTKTGETKGFLAPRIVLATGGPAGIYADSVYPISQRGSSSLALRAGAVFQNLTEWQFGLASIEPRWNVSGSYMQVLPCLISVDAKGAEREFLSETFSDPYEALSRLFLKGYQWPFDAAKVHQGSSLIDLLVFRERTQRGRRVYLDYRKNPFGLSEIDYDRLLPEAAEYLCRTGCDFGTPIQRLRHMNEPAWELYRGKGVDLETERLEIALSVQHHNGGLSVDSHWQTTVPGLYALGECAGTHGIARPGGSALNAGQVGGLRAAEAIRRFPGRLPEDAEKQLLGEMKGIEDRLAKARMRPDNSDAVREKACRIMSDAGGVFREKESLKCALRAIEQLEEDFLRNGGTDTLREAEYFRTHDTLRMQRAVLTAMLEYVSRGLPSRGSAVSVTAEGARPEGLEEGFRFTVDPQAASGQIQKTVWNPGENRFAVRWRAVRPLPETETSFETIWRKYREENGLA